DRLERPGGRLQLRDHVAGQIAGRRTRIGDRLLAFVQRLRGLQRSPRGKAVAPVRVALQRRQVVEQRRALRLFLALDLLDGAVDARDLRDDLVRTLERREDARLVALEP